MLFCCGVAFCNTFLLTCVGDVVGLFPFTIVSRFLVGVFVNRLYNRVRMRIAIVFLLLLSSLLSSFLLFIHFLLEPVADDGPHVYERVVVVVGINFIFR